MIYQENNIHTYGIKHSAKGAFLVQKRGEQVIERRRASGKIEIDGRAGFALRGQDIVCAGVSALA